MGYWIQEHAPEFVADIEAGRAKVTPLYRKLRREFNSALMRFLSSEAGRKADKARICVSRRNGRFVFQGGGA